MSDLPMTKPPSPRPLSIKIIAAWLVVSSLCRLLLQLFGPVSASEWWFLSIRGLPAFVMSVFWNALAVSLGIGLWRLWNWARKATIGFIAFNLVTATAFRFSQTYQEALMKHAGSNDPWLVPVGMVLAAAIQFPMVGLVVWFLIKRKAAFVKSSLSA